MASTLKERLEAHLHDPWRMNINPTSHRINPTSYRSSVYVSMGWICADIDDEIRLLPDDGECAQTIKEAFKVMHNIRREALQYENVAMLPEGKCSQGAWGKKAGNGSPWRWYLALQNDSHEIIDRYNDAAECLVYGRDDRISTSRMPIEDIQKFICLLEDLKGVLVNYEGGSYWAGGAIRGRIEDALPKLREAVSIHAKYTQLMSSFIENMNKMVAALDSPYIDQI